VERLDRAVREELARFGPAGGMAELVEAWPAAVGAAIARHAWPARVGRDGTLHVNTSDSIWAFELGQRAVDVAARLGVPRVRFAPGPVPSDAPAPPAEASPPRVEPGPRERAQAEQIVASIEDEELRELVARAAAASLAGASARRRV
jgi:hypothetical protein